jgi:hypothetical protein
LRRAPASYRLERARAKRRLEEYCAFRLGVVYFEKRFGVGVDDEARLVELLDSIADEMIISDNHAH